MDSREQLMSLRLSRSFSPFRVRLINGEEYVVDEKFSFAVGLDEMMIARHRMAAKHIKFSEISSIDVLEPAH